MRLRPKASVREVGMKILLIEDLAFITGFHPTAVRRTGAGWSRVVGRGVSLVGPMVGGTAVSQGIPHQPCFK
jgi:hypothetical protein